jgi:hypothetical protein
MEVARKNIQVGVRFADKKDTRRIQEKAAAISAA